MKTSNSRRPRGNRFPEDAGRRSIKVTDQTPHTFLAAVGEDTPRLHLSGELDMSNAPEVLRLLSAHASDYPGPVVAVDLSAVSFMDCAGLDPLLDVNKWLSEHDRRLVLHNVSTAVEMLFAALHRCGWTNPMSQSTHSERVANATEFNASRQDHEAIDQALGLMMGMRGVDIAAARAMLSQSCVETGTSMQALASAIVTVNVQRRNDLELSGFDALIDAAAHLALTEGQRRQPESSPSWLP